VPTGDKSNTYTLNLTEASTVTVEFESTVGIENISAPNPKIFPNPVKDMVQIAGAEGCTLQIMDVVGTVVHTQKLSASNEFITLKQLPAGLYLFKIGKAGGQMKTVKVVKK